MQPLNSGARRARLLGVALLTVAVALGVAWLPAVPQPVRYHDFADPRVCFGVPHALNVASNLGFLIAGGLGLRGLRRGDSEFVDTRERWPYALFFLSLVAVGLGSAHYHLAPSHETLFWDRLPMSVAFMSLLSAVLVERLGPGIGLRLFPWLVLAGPLSVVWWLISERAGAGDLRAYGLVHLYPLLLIPLLMALFAPRYTRGGQLLGVLALYFAALGAERLDREIFAAGGWISGHTIKHLLAALAAAWLWRMLRLRKPAPGAPAPL
ncbi:MAG: hypothetical protein Q8K96_07930 [Rubrivivax sp.]|nr:hypothetical protein [Rubrivivax sp.]